MSFKNIMATGLLLSTLGVAAQAQSLGHLLGHHAARAWLACLHDTLRFP